MGAATVCARTSVAACPTFPSVRRMAPMYARHVFLTGQPGVGKTTLVRAVVRALRDAEALRSGDDETKATAPLVKGFVTVEARNAAGDRTGFDVETVPGSPSGAVDRGPLARAATNGRAPPKGVPAVGKYAVDVASFESLAVPSISKDASSSESGPACGKRARVTVIDEVGKMEMFSERFMAEVWDALSDTSTRVLGTIPTPRYGRVIADVERVRNDPEVAVVHLKRDNRDAAANAVASVLTEAAGKEEGDVAEPFDVASLAPFLQEGQALKLARTDAGRWSRGKKNTAWEDENPAEKTAKEKDAVVPPSGRPFRADAGLGGCGPLVDVDGSTPPRVLLVGETASPLPDTPGEAYAERSMWKVLDDVLGLRRDGGRREAVVEQAEKNLRATKAGIAVWDVLGNVHSKAARGAEKKAEKKVPREDVPNDVMGFLRAHPTVTRVCFIGTKARATFAKHHAEAMSMSGGATVLVKGERGYQEVALCVLPSSSGANTRVSHAAKVKEWTAALIDS